MWKIFLFIERWILYPPYFTICFVVYYLFYVILMFKLPKINFVEEYNGDKDFKSMSAVAHILSIYVTGLIIFFYVFFKKFF